MPEDVTIGLRVAGLLKATGPHAPATVRRRLAHWSTLTRWRGLEGSFSTPGVRSALRLAMRASGRLRERKSARAITAAVLGKLLDTCRSDRLVDLRDAALLLFAFSGGGRRRSEVASLRVEQISDDNPVPSNPKDDRSPLLACMTIRLGRTKRSNRDDGRSIVLVGRPVAALKAWMERAGITEGAVFRGIDQWGNLGNRAIMPETVNLILKTRARMTGLDPKNFSAHGLRSGFLTEAANRGVPLQEAMQQSLHKSVNQAAAYYNDRKLGTGRHG